jgi:hypothetical protein
VSEPTEWNTWRGTKPFENNQKFAHAWRRLVTAGHAGNQPEIKAVVSQIKPPAVRWSRVGTTE